MLADLRESKHADDVPTKPAFEVAPKGGPEGRPLLFTLKAASQQPLLVIGKRLEAPSCAVGPGASAHGATTRLLVGSHGAVVSRLTTDGTSPIKPGV